MVQGIAQAAGELHHAVQFREEPVIHTMGKYGRLIEFRRPYFLSEISKTPP
jgi:hypothetical protein